MDNQSTVYNFLDEVLVSCPKCDACACVAPRAGEEARWFAARRLVCTACGHTRELQESAITVGSERDPFFGLPLWLSTPCCGETLWAYNAEHLQFLEEYVSARLRENVRDPDQGWSNRSLANRLPRWMKLAKNREEVLRAIRKLGERVPHAAKAPDA